MTDMPNEEILGCFTDDCTVLMFIPCSNPIPHGNCHGSTCPNCHTAGITVRMWQISDDPPVAIIAPNDMPMPTREMIENAVVLPPGGLN